MLEQSSDWDPFNTCKSKVDYVNFLVVMELFTKHAEASPTKAEKYSLNKCSTTSGPRGSVSILQPFFDFADKGTVHNDFSEKFVNLLHISKVFSTTKHLQIQGLVKQQKKTLLNLISVC